MIKAVWPWLCNGKGFKSEVNYTFFTVFIGLLLNAYIYIELLEDLVQ